MVDLLRNRRKREKVDTMSNDVIIEPMFFGTEDKETEIIEPMFFGTEDKGTNRAAK